MREKRCLSSSSATAASASAWILCRTERLRALSPSRDDACHVACADAPVCGGRELALSSEKRSLRWGSNRGTKPAPDPSKGDGEGRNGRGVLLGPGPGPPWSESSVDVMV
jgi:hypothetical protein